MKIRCAMELQQLFERLDAGLSLSLNCCAVVLLASWNLPDQEPSPWNTDAGQVCLFCMDSIWWCPEKIISSESVPCQIMGGESGIRFPPSASLPPQRSGQRGRMWSRKARACPWIINWRTTESHVKGSCSSIEMESVHILYEMSAISVAAKKNKDLYVHWGSSYERGNKATCTAPPASFPSLPPIPATQSLEEKYCKE